MPKEMGVSYGSLQLQEAANNKDLTAGVFWIMALQSSEFSFSWELESFAICREWILHKDQKRRY